MIWIYLNQSEDGSWKLKVWGGWQFHVTRLGLPWAWPWALRASCTSQFEDTILHKTQQNIQTRSTRKSQSWTYSEPWNRPGLPTQYHKESNGVSIEKTIIARAITDNLFGCFPASVSTGQTFRNLSPESLLLSAELWKLGLQRILNSTPASFVWEQSDILRVRLFATTMWSQEAQSACSSQATLYSTQKRP